MTAEELKQKSGRIHAAEMAIDVVFQRVEGTVNDLIDKAYEEKYKGNPYLNLMVSEKAKSATVRITPA